MKKFLVVLLMLFIASPAFALDKTLTFAWEQPNIESQYLSGWVLYWSDTSGSGYVKVADIPYNGVPGSEYTSTQPLTLTVTPDKPVTKYFVLTAKSQGSAESTYSNEVSKVFTVPYPVPEEPFQFTIKVIIQ